MLDLVKLKRLAKAFNSSTVFSGKRQFITLVPTITHSCGSA
jgi:hypothetical protein